DEEEPAQQEDERQEVDQQAEPEIVLLGLLDDLGLDLGVEEMGGHLVAELGRDSELVLLAAVVLALDDVGPDDLGRLHLALVDLAEVLVEGRLLDAAPAADEVAGQKENAQR